MKVFKLTILMFIFLAFGFMNSTTAQWVQVSNGMGNLYVYSLAYSGNNVFAGTLTNGVYLSTNNGSSWTQTSLNNRNVYSLAVNGNNIFAGNHAYPNSYGVYLSTNIGTSWSQTSLNNQYVYSLAVNGNYIFAGTGNFNGVYLSTNNGTSWTQTSLNNQTVYSLAINGNKVFAGTLDYGVYLSANNGTTWTQTSLNNQRVWALAVNGNNVFAGTWDNHGVFLSTNGGITFNQTTLNNRSLYSLSIDGNNIFAGTYSYGVYVSNNNGTSWTQRNEGLPATPTVYAFCILNNYIYAGTDNSVYRRPLSEIIGIKLISSEVPSSFSLKQNYPNPFNPTTDIEFSLPRSEKISLNIYDINGKEIAVLVNEKLQAGSYKADWNAVNFPSGVYFYTLRADSFIETKKMILIK